MSVSPADAVIAGIEARGAAMADTAMAALNAVVFNLRCSLDFACIFNHSLLIIQHEKL